MKVKHVYLTASQPARLAEFYEKTGLSIRFADGERWIQFRTEGAAFCVSGPEESAAAASSNAVVVFEVEKLEPVSARAEHDAIGVAACTFIPPLLLLTCPYLYASTITTVEGIIHIKQRQ